MCVCAWPNKLPCQLQISQQMASNSEARYTPVFWNNFVLVLYWAEHHGCKNTMIRELSVKIKNWVYFRSPQKHFTQVNNGNCRFIYHLTCAARWLNKYRSLFCLKLSEAKAQERLLTEKSILEGKKERSGKRSDKTTSWTGFYSHTRA